MITKDYASMEMVAATIIRYSEYLALHINNSSMMFILAFVLYSIHASASQVFGNLFCSVTK